MAALNVPETLKLDPQHGKITSPVKYVPSCVAEFVGTFLLVMTVKCNLLSPSETWGPLSIASMLMVCIYTFGPMSGGHFNPAVSISCGLARKLPGGWKQVVAYCVAQVLGGYFAAFLFSLLFVTTASFGPPQSIIWGASLCEFFYTFMLCFVVLNTAASKKLGRHNQFYCLAIGFVIIAGGYGAAPLGAGCFNPVVSLVLFKAADSHCAVYILVELLGACLAVASVQLLRPEESSDDGAFPTDYSFRSKLFGEGIGTFMVVFTVGLNVLGLSKSAALSIGAALTSMIYAIGDISGGHFNPAVTVAVLASGKGDQNARKAVRYIGAQLVAGILAAFTYAVAHRGSTFPLGPGLGYNWVGVGIVETLFTFVLTLIVLCVVISHKSNVREFDGFIIGACVVSGGFAAGSISGGSLNPAVSCGISASHIMGGGLFWKAIVYSMFELLGALVAAGVFRILHLNSAETNDVLRF